MKRTDRMYSLVEVLRAEASRPPGTRLLAERLEVTPRTVERDIAALQESGVPIRAEPGRSGGYLVGEPRTPPPISFTAEEALAVAVALHGPPSSPFGVSAAAALRKVAAALRAESTAPGSAAAGSAAVGSASDGPVPEVPRVLADALSARRVLRLDYVDQEGVATRRDVEPLGYVLNKGFWYLVAWCRQRDALRPFRTDRITALSVTDEVPQPRKLRREDLAIPYGELMQLTLG